MGGHAQRAVRGGVHLKSACSRSKHAWEVRRRGQRTSWQVACGGIPPFTACLPAAQRTMQVTPSAHMGSEGGKRRLGGRGRRNGPLNEIASCRNPHWQIRTPHWQSTTAGSSASACNSLLPCQPHLGWAHHHKSPPARPRCPPPGRHRRRRGSSRRAARTGCCTCRPPRSADEVRVREHYDDWWRHQRPGTVDLMP